MVVKLDVGCGKKIRDGFIGIDYSNYGNKDIKVFNLEDIPKKKLPFKTNSVDEIYCSHVLEHLNNPLKVLDEFNRVLKAGGKLVVVVPYFAHNSANAPFHKNYWSGSSEELFDNSYFECNSRWKSHQMDYVWNSDKLIGRVINAPFDLVIRLFGFGIYERFFCYVRPVGMLRFEAIK